MNGAERTVLEGSDDRASTLKGDSCLGAAALSICESLLLALQDRGLLDEREVDGLLEDVEVAHRNAAADEADRSAHAAVADIVSQIRNGGNSLRMLQKTRTR